MLEPEAELPLDTVAAPPARVGKSSSGWFRPLSPMDLLAIPLGGRNPGSAERAGQTLQAWCGTLQVQAVYNVAQAYPSYCGDWSFEGNATNSICRGRFGELKKLLDVGNLQRLPDALVYSHQGQSASVAVLAAHVSADQSSNAGGVDVRDVGEIQDQIVRTVGSSFVLELEQVG